MSCNSCENFSSGKREKEKEELKEVEVWLPGLVKFLEEQSQVEAVRIDPVEKSISIATIGRVNSDELKVYLKEVLVEIQKEVEESGGRRRMAVSGVYEIKQEGGHSILQKSTCYTAPRFWTWRKMDWPKLEEKKQIPEWLILGVLSGLCGVLGITGYVMSAYIVTEEYKWISYVFYILSVIAGGIDVATEVWKKLLKKELDIHFLMLAVAIGAASIGAWEEAIILLFLFSLAEALEHYAMDRTRKNIDALFKVVPKEATLVEGDNDRVVSISEIKVNSVLRIRPGDLFPVDGIIMEGQTAVDESNLTGESGPVDKKIGDNVYSGTMNDWGVVKMKALKGPEESSLQKVIRLIEEAQNLKAPSQRFAEKFGTHYTVGIFSITLLMFFVWWLWLGIPAFENTEAFGFSAFYRAMTLLVVASPCALVISIPSAILASIAWGARNGILFRGGIALEKLCHVDYVAMDKTGTLTTGELNVVGAESFPKGKEVEVEELAYALELSSGHPLARAIVRYARKKGLREKKVDNFKSLSGLGVQGMVEGERCLLGSRDLLVQSKQMEWVKNFPYPGSEYTEVWVMHADFIGRILLRDEIRKESKYVMDVLRELNLKTVMLTGDRQAVAESIGKELGVDEVRAGLHPEDKVNIIYQAGREGYKVAMIGDGVNDAPSLAAAYVSVAMGVRGSDAALEQSEIVLMQDKIDNFLEAYGLSLRAKAIIRQNLIISLGVIVVMVLSSVLGLIPLTVGVIAHEGSTLVVSLNSLRLLMGKKYIEKFMKKRALRSNTKSHF